MWLSSLDKWEYFIAIWMCINIEWMHFYLSKRRLNFCRICNQFVKRCVIGFLLISYISCSMNVHMIWTYIILLEMLTSASGENLIDFQWNAEKCKAYFMRGPYLQIIRACYKKQKICEAINSNYISLGWARSKLKICPKLEYENHMPYNAKNNISCWVT